MWFLSISRPISGGADTFSRLSSKAGARLPTQYLPDKQPHRNIFSGAIWCSFLFDHTNHPEKREGYQVITNPFLASVQAIQQLIEISNHEKGEERISSRPKLPPSYEKAYLIYGTAINKNPALEGASDHKVYTWIKEHGLGDGCDEYEPPAFSTWKRYLGRARRHYGTQKNRPRAGRSHGKSVVEQNQIQNLTEVSNQFPGT